MSTGGGRLRKRLGLVLRYGVTSCLIAWIIYSGDWDRFRQAVLAVRLRDFILSYLLLLSVQILLNALVGGILALQAKKTALAPDAG